MAETRACPKCGAPIPADAPKGVCPRCLMHKGLESTVGVEVPSSEPLAPGTEFGPYRIGRQMGRGGMGTVYEAEHIESGRQVALKVLNRKLESPEHRQRFLREGRLAASINHPNNIYIFGTEEIGGVPVIAMELARGGTLEDRVKREGPLPVRGAVDAILEIIAGLEAAQTAGVLHRDVKPSNCFVDTNGTVKVGDFGLSISTLPRADISLTQSGVFLGTPAFASPEQLRGDELDVRSDIYSVGVTLYYLLTGQTPFQAKQMVQFLATVLERPAPSPAGIRAEVPSGLAKIVLRCLAKQSAHRFRTYDELRQALLPYNSQAPTPGTLGFRVLASVADFFALSLLGALLPLLWVKDITTWETHFDALIDPGPQGNYQLMLLSVAGILMILTYFTALEGCWGATLGKAVCRLRVRRADGEAPGIPSALLRSALFWAPSWLPWWVLYAWDADAGVAAFTEDNWISICLPLVATILLFCTIRRRNGYAGIHELASGTRVVSRPAREHRLPLSVPDEPLPEMQGEQQIGPYHVLGTLHSDQTHEILLGYDARLLRKVWIRRCPATEQPIPAKLRDVGRIGRLRWLNGEREVSGGWDAYEAPGGKPLLDLIDVRQPWDAVRFWLADLADELATSLRDQTVPSILDLDRVWITPDGRAKLLDFPAPGAKASPPTERPSAVAEPDAATIGNFLKRVAIAALEMKLLDAEAASSSNVCAVLPLTARLLLNELGSPSKDTLPAAELQALTRRPASVSRGRRVGMLAACWLVPLLASAFVLTLFGAEEQFLRQYPEAGRLSGFMAYYQSLDNGESGAERPASAELREAVEIVVVDQFRWTITDREIWNHPKMKEFVDSQGQRLVEDFLRRHPDPSRDQVAAANALLQPFREEIRLQQSSADDFLYSLWPATVFLVTASGLLMLFAALPSLVSALLFGDTLLLRMLEIAVVTKTGERASRLRLVWRNTLLWSFVLLGLGLLVFLIPLRKSPRAAIALIIYLLVTIFTAQRGLHDRLAGTWLVPR